MSFHKRKKKVEPQSARLAFKTELWRGLQARIAAGRLSNAPLRKRNRLHSREILPSCRPIQRQSACITGKIRRRCSRMAKLDNTEKNEIQ